MPMKAGVFVTSVMDCCHSGTVLDLPYTFKADGEDEGMHESEGFNADVALAILGGLAGSGAIDVPIDECCAIS